MIFFLKLLIINHFIIIYKAQIIVQANYNSIDTHSLYCDDKINYYGASNLNVYKIIDVTNGKKKTIYLAESQKGKKNSLKEKKFNPNDYFYELWELNGKKYKDWTVFEWKDIEDDFFKAYATWGKTFFNMFSGNGDSNSLVNNGKLMSVLDKNGVQLTGKELNEIAYELNELIRNYKKTESKKFTRKSLKEQFVGKGEGGYRKPRANKNNSGVCKDSNGVNHKVIFDTHVEDFIVWVDNDNYLMWDIYSAGGLKRNLLKSDLDEKLIDEIAELGKQLIYGFDTDF